MADLTSGQWQYLARIEASRKSPEGLRDRLYNAMQACEDGAPRSQIRDLLSRIREDISEPPTEADDPTAAMVRGFADAVVEKLRAADEKYGHGLMWRDDPNLDGMRRELREHLEKGDPRDVAAYCAFLWYHGETTSVGRVSEASATWRGDVICATCGRERPRDLVPAVNEASALRDPDLWQVQVEGDEEVDAYCTEAEAEAAAVQTRRDLIEEYAESGSRHLVPDVHVYPVWVGSPLLTPSQEAS